MAITPEDTVVLVDVFANDFDHTGHARPGRDHSRQTPPPMAVVVNAGGGKFAYTPAAGFRGGGDLPPIPSVTPAAVISNIATVTVIAKRSNKLPVASDDKAATPSMHPSQSTFCQRLRSGTGNLTAGTVSAVASRQRQRQRQRAHWRCHLSTQRGRHLQLYLYRCRTTAVPRPTWPQ